MANDALGPSICVDHPYEITVQLEDRRNPCGDEAGDTCCRTRPGPCRASSPVVSALGLARFRSPAHLLLPCGSPALAILLQVLALLFLQGRSPRFKRGQELIGTPVTPQNLGRRERLLSKH